MADHFPKDSALGLIQAQNEREQRERDEQKKNRLFNRRQVQKIFADWREFHPGESNSFVEKKIVKGWAFIDAKEDEAELQQYILRSNQRILQSKVVDPDVVAAFELAMEIAKKRTAAAFEDSDELIRKLVNSSHKGGKVIKDRSKDMKLVCQGLVNGILLDEGSLLSKREIAPKIREKLKELGYAGGSLPAESTIRSRGYINLPSNEEWLKLKKAADEKARKKAEEAGAREKAVRVKARNSEQIQMIVDLAGEAFAQGTEADKLKYIQNKLRIIYKKEISTEEIINNL